MDDDFKLALFEAEVFDEFDEEDPRRGPHSPEERAMAVALIDAPNRWHYRKREVDWFAARLQFGRGFDAHQVSHMFGIGYSSLNFRRRDESWTQRMSDRDRRTLSRLVWLAGIARGLGDSEEGRAVLAAWSDWRVPESRPAQTFQPQDRHGAPRPITFNPEEFPDDAYYTDADPKRDDRFAVRTKLDELIARMERDVADEAARNSGEMVQAMACGEGRPDEPAPDREGMGPVGQSGADHA